jgi:hypothetical protein
MKIKYKYKTTSHKRLIGSSFTDFSNELNVNPFKRLFYRIIGMMHSSYYYQTAEKYIEKHYPEVARSQKVARLDGGLSGEYQWIRLAEIKKIVKLYDINSVCEFGSGASTAMFSQLGLEKLITLEQSEKWAQKTLEALPENAFGKVIRVDRIVEEFDHESCTRYDMPSEFYQNYFDLIYIDGPTARVLEGDETDKIVDPNQTMPNIDIELFLQNNNFPKVILVDARRASVRRLCKKYHDKYDIYMRYSYEGVKNRSGNFLYHTVFIRK